MATITILDGNGTPQSVQAPLVAGRSAAATSAPVTLSTEDKASLDGILTNTQLRASAVPISGTITANAGTGTFAVSAAALPLPTGAATAANQTALQGLFPATLGQKTMANSLAVTLSSDQSAISIIAAAPTACSRLLSAAATTNATSVKASSGTIKGIQGYNAKASPVFLKLYNKATAPTVGTDVPVKTIYLPPTAAFALDFSFTLGTGIAFALTGAAADADTTALVAGDVLCLNVDYI